MQISFKNHDILMQRGQAMLLSLKYCGMSVLSYQVMHIYSKTCSVLMNTGQVMLLLGEYHGISMLRYQVM